MPRLLLVQPFPPEVAAAHQRWCDELRRRREELAESRRRVGIWRQVQWVQPAQGLGTLWIDAHDPYRALEELERSIDPFDQWYRECEREVHGGPPLREGWLRPDLLHEYHNGIVDEFDMFIASALPVRPGLSAQLRQAVTVSSGGGGGQQRLRRWGLKRLAIWMQATERGDIVVYESAGDIPEMVRSLTVDQDPLIAEQRSILDRVFGLDLAQQSFPVPLPAFSWTDR